MALSFPNPSRSYDSRQRCVRFWAHDAALEIPFFIEADALCGIAPKTIPDEPGLLEAFDRNRARICQAAGKVYARGQRGSYTLAASDIA
jgi:hypothetical protein